MDKRENFIKRCVRIHGDKYNYSKVEYVNSTTKVCIICPDHGEFWMEPSSHLRGCECPKCANIKRGKKDTIYQFLDKARSVHGDKYDYSKVDYKNANTKVCIICPEHGEFWQLPSSHINGQGCPMCAGRNKTTEDIINDFRKIHGDKYDYSKVVFTKMHEKVCIICPEHGEFWQTPSKHISKKQGCPKCGKQKMGTSQRLTTETFIEKAKLVHGDKYNYSKVGYVDAKTKVCIVCPKHGEFWQLPFDHLDGHGCQKCGLVISNKENEIIEFLNENLVNEVIISHNRQLIKPYELDIYLPNKGIAIEYNGLKWHSEEFGKNKYYHLNKLKRCNENGIKLIQIFEDEYVKHSNIVKSKLLHILGKNKNKPKIYGRKCKIKEISFDEYKDFMIKYHIQSYTPSSVYLGAFYEDKIIAAMSFIRNSKDDNKWELNRFASDYHYVCCGVGGKLFKYFINGYNPDLVKSFADRRWTINERNNIYLQLGFKFDSYTDPDYKYVYGQMPNQRIHKFNFRKGILGKKYNIDESKTESQLSNELGYHKIWDCGLIRYVWKKNREV